MKRLFCAAIMAAACVAVSCGAGTSGRDPAGEPAAEPEPATMDQEGDRFAGMPEEMARRYAFFDAPLAGADKPADTYASLDELLGAYGAPLSIRQEEYEGKKVQRLEYDGMSLAYYDLEPGLVALLLGFYGGTYANGLNAESTRELILERFGEPDRVDLSEPNEILCYELSLDLAELQFSFEEGKLSAVFLWNAD